jgi:tyrosyl-tRNA synthetase
MSNIEENTSTEEALDPAVEKEVERQLKVIEFGASEITPRNELVKMLRHSIKTETPLRVKGGIDPTAADIHLGHSVVYRKMRQFQDLGHIGVVIIGDYTAGIGDPTGRNDMRPPLSKEDIELNARTYMEQVYSIVREDRTEVSRQTEWFEEADLRDVLSWASQTTVAKLMSHETFKERLEKGNPLALHELLYPVLQGIDSVYVNADVELGGTDQKFNVLMGRDYQRHRGQRPQVAVLTPLLTGTCGTAKMSKSLGNYIGVLDEPFDKFGKVMSIPDAIMMEYYQYLTTISPEDYATLKTSFEEGKAHPNELKKDLAQQVVAFFHGTDLGSEMRNKFESVFKRKQVPDDIPEYSFERGDDIISALFKAGLIGSKKEGKRLLTQNAIGFHEGEK